MIIDHEFLDTQEAASYLGMSVNTLRLYRSLGKPPYPACKVGRKLLYKREALKQWLENRVTTLDGVRTLKLAQEVLRGL
jgi:excisionase family DNA binding protein